ncbi:hypothetical protein B0H10DRAFT_2168474 [Mycena sp. CBHHK59/15]|nr:hypothetical protein B0H10DRAFT_2168474 [Mycena sp. CBHHK59/15]
MAKNRKATFKVPPSSATDLSESQELRRRKALEEQKRKRAQKVDSARQLDLFADLNLGESDDEDATRHGNSDVPKHRKKKARKQKSKKETQAGSSKWADQCMYAELLEMSADDPWSAGADGLPEDLETGWVAVAPVPVGKRCLAVTDQSLGVPGLVSNTSLRSRKLGKLLMPRFPSTLPPLTILDCILDDNWRTNGILHVLDVVKWKGQDIGDCETPFRFWWRDTRLEELPVSLPPSHSADRTAPGGSATHAKTYRFPYPTKFLPIPYHTDTSLSTLASRIVPLARTSRSVDVDVPVSHHGAEPGESGMEVDQQNEPVAVFSTHNAEIVADGLLLYVSEASYEAGTSPLSSWIPKATYGESRPTDGMTDSSAGFVSCSSLIFYHRLIQKRIARKQNSGYHSSVQMETET